MSALPAERVPGLRQLLAAQGAVLYALMLRDIRTRFFGTALGFLVTIAWPLSHLGAIILINAGLGRAAPYGQSSALWFATGTVPFIAFSYVSRFCVWGMVTNKPMLAYPIVRVTDILFSRMILEILNSVIVVVILAAAFWCFGIDFIPANLTVAASAFLAAVLLGVGFGIFNSIIAAFMPMWFTVYSLSMIVFWIASGILFVPDALPDQAVYWLSYNPVLQCVEWMRSAYYDDYGAHVLDKQYTLVWAAGSILAGLALERVVRGKILSG
ncbi:capsular polysaccharide transport system permease protein [Roseiarcus fermentans]|uniref:Capsular polysaccharide transport system permease protein n=1 Tax=Roseiarcus fermentans TaxID=1473586 RepID=A0A366EQE0_9HYPH|nr:ABC transporter permease [Roseiarcus fermentans]RBP04633.1 capsular polysaccharide transport system permease protein [Roseiarcus fermentans]